MRITSSFNRLIRAEALIEIGGFLSTKMKRASFSRLSLHVGLSVLLASQHEDGVDHHDE